MKDFYSTLGIDNAIKQQEEDNIKANNNLNNMKDWKEIYKKKFGLCSEKSDKCDCYRELKFIENLLSQQMKAPMGVSQWREYGKKYHYWQYFEEEVRKEVLEEERQRIYAYIEDRLIGDNNELLRDLSNIIFDIEIKSLINKQ